MFAALTVVLLAWYGQYSSRRRISRIDDALGLAKALVVAIVAVLGLAIITKGFGTGFTNYSRGVLLTDVAELFVLMVVARLVAWVWQPRLFRRGEGVRRLLVAGTGASASRPLHRRPSVAGLRSRRPSRRARRRYGVGVRRRAAAHGLVVGRATAVAGRPAGQRRR